MGTTERLIVGIDEIGPDHETERVIITDSVLKAMYLRLVPTYSHRKYPSGTTGCLCEFEGVGFCRRDNHDDPPGDNLHIIPATIYGEPAIVWEQDNWTFRERRD